MPASKEDILTSRLILDALMSYRTQKRAPRKDGRYYSLNHSRTDKLIRALKNGHTILIGKYAN